MYYKRVSYWSQKGNEQICPLLPGEEEGVNGGSNWPPADTFKPTCSISMKGRERNLSKVIQKVKAGSGFKAEEPPLSHYSYPQPPGQLGLSKGGLCQFLCLGLHPGADRG